MATRPGVGSSIDQISHGAVFSQVWCKLAEQADARPIAIYGAGKHTSSLLNIVSHIADGPEVAFIIDDNPAGLGRICGVPVRTPSTADPQSVSIVLVSSDTIESKLAECAEQWAQCVAPPHRPKVVRLYADLAPQLAELKPPRIPPVKLAIEPHDYIPIDPEHNVLRLHPRIPTKPDKPFPVPPPGMRSGYAVADDKYLADGQTVNTALRSILAEHQVDVAKSSDILEWGCSTGRAIRHWRDIAAKTRIWGCDIDASAVEWCNRNLAPSMRFFQATTRPHLPMPDATFDFMYGISVFTHISELIEAWLLELRRITKPGGFVIVTVHDETSWQRCATQDRTKSLARLCPDIDFSAPMQCDFVAQGRGKTRCTFWRADAIRERWSFAFDILEIRPRFAGFDQSAVIMRRSD